MSTHVDSSGTFPVPLRWIVVPVLGWAMLSAAAALIRRQKRRPTVSAMSTEWLRANERTVGRTLEL